MKKDHHNYVLSDRSNMFSNIVVWVYLMMQRAGKILRAKHDGNR